MKVPTLGLQYLAALHSAAALRALVWNGMRWEMTPRPKDTRVSWIDHPQNWFLAAPSGDLFIHRLQQCVWQFMDGAPRTAKRP